MKIKSSMAPDTEKNYMHVWNVAHHYTNSDEVIFCSLQQVDICPVFGMQNAV